MIYTKKINDSNTLFIFRPDGVEIECDIVKVDDKGLYKILSDTKLFLYEIKEIKRIYNNLKFKQI